jgi:hypothetical protein
VNSALLAALLPIIMQYSITGVKDVIALIEGNPQQQGEADADYVARMGALIDANTQAIQDEDTDIQK